MNTSFKRIVVPYRGIIRRARYKTRHSWKAARRKYSVNALEAAKGRTCLFCGKARKLPTDVVAGGCFTDQG